MSCVAVIAVKQRSLGKSHLAGCLSSYARIDLIRAMLVRVIEASCGAHLISDTLVVSPERDTVPGFIPVILDSGAGMCEAFELARNELRRRGVRSMVALPADLPGVQAADLDAIVSATDKDGIAIAPDQGGRGTNALFCGTALPLRFRFGVDSCMLHVAEARTLGVEPIIVTRPGFGFDVDLPGDLMRLLGPGSREQSTK